MLRWLKSIRVKTLGIMGLATILGLAITYIAVNAIEHRIEVNQDLQSLSKTSAQLLTISNNGATLDDLKSASTVLNNERIVVDRGPITIFQSGPPYSLSTSVLSLSKTDGTTTVYASIPSPTTDVISAELTTAAGFLVLLALIGAALISRMVTQSMSTPIARAIEASQKVASGDLTARIGDMGSDDFQSLANAFDSMAAKLEDHENEQKKFLGDLSHEIATPINAVSGFAIAICDRTIDSPEQLSEAAWLIQEETDRINHLLTDLRTLDRLDIAHTVTKEEFYADIYIKELVLRFSASSTKKSLAVNWSAPHEKLLVDRRLLDMVVSNFLSNSIRYVDPGGKIWINVKRHSQDLVFSVIDNGIGIEPAHLNRIFDRLYRVDEARDRVSGGSGLGLAIARRASQSLGGRIEVESTSGNGSEFRLLIPAAQAIHKHSRVEFLKNLTSEILNSDDQGESKSTKITSET